jgi:uncharacterized membrane protein
MTSSTSAAETDTGTEAENGADGPTAHASRIKALRGLVIGHPHGVAVALLTVVTTVVYAAYLITRYKSLNYGLLDLGIYDQAVREYSHFHAPHSPVVALPNADSPGLSQLSDHFTPILAVIAPLYWIHDSPLTLLIAGGVLMAVAIPPIWVFTRRAISVPAAYLVAIAFAVAWPVQNALWFGFHEVSFAVPILACMLERAQAGRRRQAALISLLLLLVKDDMGFVVAAFGVLLLVRPGPRGAWRQISAGLRLRAPWRDRLPVFGGVGLVLAGAAMVELVTKKFIPAAGGSPERNWTYDSLAATPGGLVKFLLEHPLTGLHRMVAPDAKVSTLLWLFAPLLFLPLLSPISLLALPLLVERFLSDNNMYWYPGLHYNAYLVVILLLAGVDGAARLGRWTGRITPRIRLIADGRAVVGTAWAAIVAVVALAVLPKWPMWDMTKPAFWTSTSTYDVRVANEAAGKIPDGVLVAVAAQIGPLVTPHAKVFMWSYPGDRSPVDQPPWVLADVKRVSSPWRSVADQKKRVEELIGLGYAVVYERDGYVVLHKP